MGPVPEIGEFFFLSFALGLGLASALVDWKEVGGGPIRLIAFLCGSSTTIGLLLRFLNSKTSPEGLDKIGVTFYVLATLSFVFIFSFHQEKKTLPMWLLYLLHSFCLLSLLILGNPGGAETFLFLLSSSLFLGLIVFSMVRGHWYLVTPKLEKGPLALALQLLWFIFIIKALIIATHSSSLLSHWEKGGIFSQLMFITRVLWGYLAVLIASFFSWKLVRMKSFQSATGIFYAMVIFVFVGEMISSYLFFKHGLFL